MYRHFLTLINAAGAVLWLVLIHSHIVHKSWLIPEGYVQSKSYPLPHLLISIEYACGIDTRSRPLKLNLR